ncbi:peptide chain release factor 1, mitochondrial isoform X2 [Zootoca vivipara]|uniref:peptide chain release factor 1, mitochondrial isoform X2 n=1 Tax=Zootoca vivipara TaxID=8524 RepID=UPI0015929A84|nr:peptide chain release factor 1, mitochondrial isoform X2 [Zootoca vivipara]
MKLHQTIPFFRTLHVQCYCSFQQRHLPLLVKRATCWTKLNTFWHSCLWNTVAPIVAFNNWPRRYHQTSGTLWNLEALQTYLQTLSQEYQRLEKLLNDSSVKEHRRRALSKRHAELSPLAVTLKEIREAEKELQDLEILCSKLNSPEEKPLLELALEEKKIIDQKISTLCRKIFQILIPREKYDDCGVLLEVTCGRTTGGDICQQFTQEVFDMYRNYADYKCWTFEIVNYTPADYGGLHHAAARILGDDVYKHLKYEGGTHRVQRIPETGLSSRMQRIHTGTMSVIVLPQPDEKHEHQIYRNQYSICVAMRTTQPDGRGLTVECQEERSQQVNRETALRTLRDKLYQQTIERELRQRQSNRKLQLGTRAQAERIRTYNFHQDRVTDHRVTYEMRDIKEFLSGKKLLDELINKLLEAAEMESLIEHLENNLKSLQADS